MVLVPCYALLTTATAPSLREVAIKQQGKATRVPAGDRHMTSVCLLWIRTSLSTGKPTGERRCEEVAFWGVVLCNSLAAGNESVNYGEVCEAAFPTQLQVGAAQDTWGCRHPACWMGSSDKELRSWMLQQLGRLYRLPGERGSPAAGSQGLLHLGETKAGSIGHLCLLPLKLLEGSAHSREMASCLINSQKNPSLSHLQMFLHLMSGGWMLAENKTSFCCCFLNPFCLHYSAQWCGPYRWETV